MREPHKSYTGETRFPLILQNSHRACFYAATLFNVVLTYDAILAFRDPEGAWGHMGVGNHRSRHQRRTVVDCTRCPATSCRHIFGGRLNSFSRHPLRYRFWT